jgi:hypothetical protein
MLILIIVIIFSNTLANVYWKKKQFEASSSNTEKEMTESPSALKNVKTNNKCHTFWRQIIKMSDTTFFL